MSKGERDETPPAARKEDSETLALRGRPRPVIRIRRGLIIGVTGVTTAALVGLAWMALEPPSFRLAGGAEEPLAASRVADDLANAPATYADVPKLGPPLPGDLGRPILDQQRKLAGGAEGMPDAGRDAEAERAAAELQRRVAEEQAARASAVLAQISKSSSGAAPSQTSLPAVTAPDTTEIAAAPSIGTQQRKLEFARSGGGDVNPHALAGPASPWTLAAGTVITASLVTGLNSDLPGMVVAQVTENVRDSATGQAVLIPQGARLIGSYDSVVAFGQQRALLVWKRIILPDGSSISLDNMPATDAAGYAGLEDKIDFHEWRLLKGIMVSSLLDVGSELGIGGDDRDLVRALRESAGANGSRAGEQIVSRNLDVQPTLTVRPGWPVRAIVHSDLVLRPWRG